MAQPWLNAGAATGATPRQEVPTELFISLPSSIIRRASGKKKMVIRIRHRYHRTHGKPLHARYLILQMHEYPMINAALISDNPINMVSIFNRLACADRSNKLRPRVIASSAPHTPRKTALCHGAVCSSAARSARAIELLYPCSLRLLENLCRHQNRPRER